MEILKSKRHNISIIFGLEKSQGIQMDNTVDKISFAFTPML